MVRNVTNPFYWATLFAILFSIFLGGGMSQASSAVAEVIMRVVP